MSAVELSDADRPELVAYIAEMEDQILRLKDEVGDEWVRAEQALQDRDRMLRLARGRILSAIGKREQWHTQTTDGPRMHIDRQWTMDAVERVFADLRSLIRGKTP